MFKKTKEKFLKTIEKLTTPGKEKVQDERKEDSEEMQTELALAAKFEENDPEYFKATREQALGNPEIKKSAETLREKAEGFEITISDLQGGFEWIGLPEKDQIKKHVQLSQAYLVPLTGKHGFKVKIELNNTDKLKYNLGAGDLLPPSVKTIEVTDLGGNTRQGARQTIDSRTGYYDEQGAYVQIFGGYTIKPIDFMKTTSDEYKKTSKEELQNYKDRKAAEMSYHEGTTTTPEDILQYTGRTDYPISSTQSLRTTPLETLSKTFEAKDRAEQMGNIERAKRDLKITEAILGKFGVRMDARSEANGGMSLVMLNRKGLGLEESARGMLGWTEKMEENQESLLQKLDALDPEKIEDNKEIAEGVAAVKDPKEEKGYYLIEIAKNTKITDLETWTIKRQLPLVQENDTTRFIKAMQNGAPRDFLGYKFVGNYNLDFSQLADLHNLATSDKEELKKILKSLQEKTPGKPISPRALTERLYENPDLPQGMTPDAAMAYARKHNIRFMMGHGYYGKHHMTIKELTMGSTGKRGPVRPGQLKYMFNIDQEHLDSLARPNGSSACAHETSRFLGLIDERKPHRGQEGGVSGLVPRLTQGILKKTNGRTAGIVMGFENFRRGDVIVWKGSKIYGTNRYGHIGIIRDTLTIDGEKYMAIQHDFADIQIDLVPVNRRSHTAKHVEKMLKNRRTRAEYIRKYPKLKAFYDYRAKYPKTVHVRKSSGWWGDASKNSKNYIAFAIRASILDTGNTLAKQP
jgi:hypothetical protein